MHNLFLILIAMESFFACQYGKGWLRDHRYFKNGAIREMYFAEVARRKVGLSRKYTLIHLFYLILFVCLYVREL